MGETKRDSHDVWLLKAGALPRGDGDGYEMEAGGRTVLLDGPRSRRQRWPGWRDDLVGSARDLWAAEHDDGVSGIGADPPSALADLAGRLERIASESRKRIEAMEAEAAGIRAALAEATP